MKALLGLLLGLFFSSVVIADSLPNRQRRLSIHHLSQTNMGNYLIEKAGGPNILFERLIFDDIQNPNSMMLSEYIETEEGFKINLNAHLLASSSIYMSWALAHGIAKYRVKQIELEYAVELPLFIENTQWAMYLAMKHWEQLNYPNDHDYAKHPDSHIAEIPKKLQASTTELSRYFKTSKGSFLTHARNRHLSLDYPNIKLKDYVESDEISPSQRKAAKKLLKIINEES